MTGHFMCPTCNARWFDDPSVHDQHGTPVFTSNEGVAPIPMFLTCPMCGERHIDEGEFATRVHHTHSCQRCGLTWRPAREPTVGVQFLPGFKNQPEAAKLEKVDELRARILERRGGVPLDDSAKADTEGQDDTEAAKGGDK